MKGGVAAGRGGRSGPASNTGRGGSACHSPAHESARRCGRPAAPRASRAPRRRARRCRRADTGRRVTRRIARKLTPNDAGATGRTRAVEEAQVKRKTRRDRGELRSNLPTILSVRCRSGGRRPAGPAGSRRGTSAAPDPVADVIAQMTSKEATVDAGSGGRSTTHSRCLAGSAGEPTSNDRRNGMTQLISSRE
jgi:hypothetical protein